MKCNFACLALLLATSLAAADEKPALTFTVTGGEHDLLSVIVRVPIPAKALGAATDVRVQGDEPAALYLAQVTPAHLLAADSAAAEITFILPQLKAGETKSFKVLTVFAVRALPKSFQWKDTPGEHADLLFGSTPVLRCMYAPLDDSSKERREQTYKVYHHVFAPMSGDLLTKGPGGLYTHHRGLFFAFNKVTYGDKQKADVWHCTGDAFQSHDGFEQSVAGNVLGRHRLKIGWHGEGKKVFAEEERELTAFRDLTATFIEFNSIVRPKAPNLRLDGDPQHSGFHFRAAQEVADQFSKKMPQTYFLRPDGKGKIGEERNWDPKTKKGPVNLPWDAMSFVLGEQRYTALYLDHPDNPKESRGSERIYGRVGNYFEYDLTEDKPLRVQYRIWIQPGEMTVEQCESLSRAFSEPVKVVVK